MTIQQELSSIAEMAYGHGIGNGEKGGNGRIGMINGHVVKFNTHLRERLFGTKKNQAMYDSCNALRARLIEIAVKAKLDEAQIDVIRGELGLKPGEDPAKCTELLDRKVVAKVVNLIANSYNEAHNPGRVSVDRHSVDVWNSVHRDKGMRSQSDMDFTAVASRTNREDAPFAEHIEKAMGKLIGKHFPAARISQENLKQIVREMQLGRIFDSQRLVTAAPMYQMVQESFENVRGVLVGVLGAYGSEAELNLVHLRESITNELTRSFADLQRMQRPIPQSGWMSVAMASDVGRITPEYREFLLNAMVESQSEEEVESMAVGLDAFTNDPFTPAHLQRMEAVFTQAGKPAAGAKAFLEKLDGLRRNLITGGKPMATAEETVSFFEHNQELWATLDPREIVEDDRQEFKDDFLTFLKNGYDRETRDDERLMVNVERSVGDLLAEHFPSVEVSSEDLKALVLDMDLARIRDMRTSKPDFDMNEAVRESVGKIKDRLMAILGVDDLDADGGLDEGVLSFKELLEELPGTLSRSLADPGSLPLKSIHRPAFDAIVKACNTGRVTPKCRQYLLRQLAMMSMPQANAMASWLDKFVGDPFTAEHLQRMEKLFAAAKLPVEGAKDLLRKLDIVRLHQITNCTNPTTAEDSVSFYESYPDLVVGMDLRLNLEGNGDAIKSDFMTFLTSCYEEIANGAKDKPGSVGGDANVFMIAVREYDEGELTINGEPIPTKPSRGHKAVFGDAAGTNLEFKQAMIEQLMLKIPDKPQRLMVSCLLSMANGVQGYFSNRFNEDDPGKNPCNKAVSMTRSLAITNAKCMTGLGRVKPMFDMTVDESTGDVNLKFRIGMKQGYEMFNGVGVEDFGAEFNSDKMICEAHYYIELNVPKPLPGKSPKIELVRMENVPA